MKKLLYGVAAAALIALSVPAHAAVNFSVDPNAKHTACRCAEWHKEIPSARPELQRRHRGL